ncbi:unnamed protein product, partial [marine sediment metagenome]
SSSPEQFYHLNPPYSKSVRVNPCYTIISQKLHYVKAIGQKSQFSITEGAWLVTIGGLG